VRVSGLMADVDAATVHLKQVQAQAVQQRAELQRQLGEKEMTVASLHQQVLWRWLHFCCEALTVQAGSPCRPTLRQLTS
jgi:hypothetical protein